MNRNLNQRQIAAIERALAVMIEPGQVVEVRIINVDGRKQRVDSGYFDDMHALAQRIPSYTRRAEGIYITLNPVNPALLARAANRIKHWSSLTTSDTDITYRRWLPIDIDPVRPTGISATQSEHEAAHAKAQAVQSWLTTYGWADPIYADSGNGAHLLYRVDLPNDTKSAQLLQGCLQAIACKHNDKCVQIDVGNFNAARIWKLYYTLSAKGDSTPTRPHRWSHIISADSPLSVVTERQLSQLAASAPTPMQAEAPSVHFALDIDGWLERHGIKASKSTWKDGWRWKLNECPFTTAHRDGAYIVQLANGAISAGCHHNSCKGKTWRDLRTLLEGVPAENHSTSTESPLQEMIRTEMTGALHHFVQMLASGNYPDLIGIPSQQDVSTH